MRPSTFLLEVVVGELSLTSHLSRPVTSPAVCVQIRGGPPLVIPYLSPAFTSTLGQPHTHPRQFMFQRGKSCIFSAPWHPFVASKGAGVKVEVLRSASDGVGVQSALVGCHEGCLVPQDESATLLVLRGTLPLTGRDKESVGAISISISMKCLGVEVPAGGRISHTPTGVPGIYEESFNVLQDAQVPYENLPASERIALRIASFEDPASASFPPPMRAAPGEWEWWQDSPRRVGELAQPLPIMYLGWDAEGERLWEEKLALMDQEKEQDSEGEVDGGRESDQDSDTLLKNTSHISHTRQPNRKPKRQHHSPKTKRRQPRKQAQTHSQPSRPRGWLRSTPLAPQCTAKPPRLNRTHLLRLAASNSQLDRDLKAEVERRVRSRVRDLEDDFFTLIGKLATKRTSRVNYGTSASVKATRRALQSVGCQTDIVRERVPVNVVNDGSVSPYQFLQHDTSPHRHTPPPQETTPHHSCETKGTQTDAKHTPEHRVTKNTRTDKQTLTETPPNTLTNKHKHKPKDSNTRPLAETPPDGLNVIERAGRVLAAPLTERPTREAAGTCDNARLLLGDIPKNLTYVIGPDGEKVYVGIEEARGRDGEREQGGEGEMQEEERGGKGNYEKEEENSERQISERIPHTTSSSSSSSSSSPAPPLTPRPSKHPFLTPGEQPLREPSQDTWGLTYTIHPADQDTSTSTRKSTPATHLSSSSVDAGGSGEVEEEVEEGQEVEEGSSVSSVSNEVFREIWKGRKADLLSAIASSPLQSVGESLLSPPTSAPHSQPSGVVDGSLNSTSATSTHSKRQKDTSKHDSLYQTKPPKTSDQFGTINGTSRPLSARSSGTSISDISARIAALLVARKIEVPRLNTESVSSYVPSDQSGTLSSMSDVLMSPSSSSSSSD